MRIAVGMSGGVDSTVAAALLVAQGHDVIGLTMQIWDGTACPPSDGRSSCYGSDEPQELEEVRALAARLGIKHHTIPLVEEYRTYVLDYFRREYQAGRTPNPCVMCNREVKFGFLLSRAKEVGLDFERFATGHYARVESDPKSGRFILKRGIDLTKDQSYFLAHLTREQLGKVCFPLGDLTKEHVRETARKLGFHSVADRLESQDFVCGEYASLFEDGSVQPGPIVDGQENVLGQHRGIVNYTIGQRKGLGLSGHATPRHVVSIDAARNALVVGDRKDLFAQELIATGLNWIAIDELVAPMAATVRIRQQHPDARAVLHPVRDGSRDAVHVVFDEPQMSIAPGQAAVFYEGDTVLGGGWIDRVVKDVKKV